MKKKLVAVIVLLLVVVLFLLVNRLRHRDENGRLRLSGNVEVTEMNLGFRRRDASTSVLWTKGNG